MSNYQIGDVVAAMRKLAPEAWAEEWDNVGWLVRRDMAREGPLRVVLSLDPVDPEAARAAGCHLNVCHHPTPFRPLTRVDDATWAVRAWAAGLDLYAAHTNLDAAPGGVNDALAEALGLEETRPMLPSEAARLVKFVTYVPPDDADAVRKAAAEAGAGTIGRYDECSFMGPGTGTFRPLPGADPYTGTPIGELERAEEVRLEMVVPAHREAEVVAAARAAHPYEGMAYDVVPLAQPDPRVGLGRVGTLPEPMSLDAFLERVAGRLGTDRISVSGPSGAVRTVAVMGGSGGRFFRAAKAAGADVYVTGEAGHHDALDSAALGLTIVDAGHFATERPVVARLERYLTMELPGLDLTIADETDPLRRASL